MPTPGSDPLIGTQLEKVRILEKLGAGGMGAVYLGEHQLTRKKVAVKILPEHLSKDPEYIARFRREATTASRLQHPNIVEVFDIGVAGGKYFIVMSWVDGVSLQTVIETMGTIPPADAAKVAIGVLQGLNHAHQAGVIHRDIKPDNILVTKDNDGKILDFGLAIETEETQKLTAAGTVVGTPLFISPEQARGHQADPRSDLYSLGVTLYQCVTGRTPFSGQNALALLNKHIHETPPPPSQLNPRVPPELNDFIVRLMAKRPQDRYANADLARRDLEAFLAGRPLSAPRPTTGGAKRAPIWVWGYAAGIVTFVSVVFALWMAGRNGPPAPSPTTTVSPTKTAPPTDDPALAPDRERLQALIREAAEHFDDHGSYPGTLKELALLEGRHPHDALLPEILKARAAFEGRIAGLAEEAYGKLKARLDAAANDPLAERAVLRDFPRGLIEVTPRGHKVRERLAELETARDAYIRAELDRVDGLIGAGDTAAAHGKLDSLARHAPMEFQDRIERLAKKLEERERVAVAAAETKVEAALRGVEPRIDRETAARATTAAWKLLVGLIAAYPPATPEGIVFKMDAPLLTSIDPQQAGEPELLHATGLADGWAAEGGRPPRIRAALLLGDLLRIEWLQRRAARGLARLDGTDLELFDTKGRLSSKSLPAIFSAPGDSSVTLDLRKLRTVDLFTLAGGAEPGEGSPAERAFEKSAPLCLAAASDSIHGVLPDRWLAGRRWFNRARDLHADVAVARFEDFEREVPLELEKLRQAYFGETDALVREKKWPEAARALERAEKAARTAGILPTFGPLLHRRRAELMAQEVEAKLDGNEIARLRDIVKELREQYADAMPAEELDRLRWKVAWRNGMWTGNHMPADQPELNVSSLWDWDGKEMKTPAPAKVEMEGGVPTLRLALDRRLFLRAEKTEGVNGMAARFKLNEDLNAWSAGLYCESINGDIDQKFFRVTSAGRGEYIVYQQRQGAVKQSVRLATPIVSKQWFEIGWVFDKPAGEVIFYVQGDKDPPQPLFAVAANLDPKRRIGIWTLGNFSMRELRLREARR